VYKKTIRPAFVLHPEKLNRICVLPVQAKKYLSELKSQYLFYQNIKLPFLEEFVYCH
jgi:hypothetical protein